MLDNTNIFHQTSYLGESAEDYLKAIFVLSQQKRTVRVKDIAGYLMVSRPSVVSALTALVTKGLVLHEHYGNVELTPKGRQTAGAVYRRHLLLEYFLTSILGVNRRTAHQDACRLEHALSPETIRRLMGFVARMKNYEKVE
ncbi:MAG: metal-dependent transcriptional regulator [bacterium]